MLLGNDAGELPWSPKKRKQVAVLGPNVKQTLASPVAVLSGVGSHCAQRADLNCFGLMIGELLSGRSTCDS